MIPERWSKWSKEDNDRLIELVNENTFNGVINWCNVMIYFPHKPKNSVQAHYTYSLNPAISHSKRNSVTIYFIFYYKYFYCIFIC